MKNQKHADRATPVTGPASGIGHEVGHDPAIDEGASVYLADRDAAGAAAAAASIRKLSSCAQEIEADIGHAGLMA